MAVPAHDERDFEFAKKYNLPIKSVIASPEGTKQSHKIATSPDFVGAPRNDGTSEIYVGEGEIVNSGDWNGLRVPDEIGKVIDWLEEKKIGKRRVTYHLHDWSISRQRYWGTPVPMIHCDSSAGGCGIVPVPLDDLPVELPYEVDYTPKGKPPLATAEKWLNVKCPKCGKAAKRDAETLDTFFDSSWYYYRYICPDEKKAPFDKLQVKELMPLDIYFGGSEHTLGHTLYARFFTKFFKELGLVEFDEFAKKRVQHGIILGPDGNRMSKSKGNVVNPDDVVRVYGADTVRLYLCFMMPYEATAPWNPTAISGIYRFLRRVWDLYEKCQMSNPDQIGENDKYPMSNEDLYWLHKTIKKVGEDLGDIKFNTAVASLMEWLNYLSRKEAISLEEYETLLLLLAPLAPHIAEELFQILQNSKSDSVHLQEWPMYDEKYLVEDEVTIVVQVNGKVRENIQVKSEKLKVKSEIEKLARESEKVKGYLEGKTVKNVIYIEGKLLNFVTS
jgi:leucyl-tRNA synthetase